MTEEKNQQHNKFSKEQDRPTTKRRPSKSLKSILTLWFLLFSIVPLAFVTGYSMVQFERAIDDELYKRLRGNSREISAVFSDLENYLSTYGNIHASDATLVYYLLTSSVSNSRHLLQGWMKSYSASIMSLFDQEGRLIVALGRGEGGEPKNLPNLESGGYYLPESLIKQLETQAQQKFQGFNKDTKMLELVVYTRVVSRKGTTVGYLQEIIVIDEAYLEGMKRRLNLEVFLTDSAGEYLVTTSEDFKHFPKGYFVERLNDQKSAFIDVVNRGMPYAVKIQPLKENDQKILLGLAASKRDVTNALKGINKALFTIVGVIILLLVVTLLAASNLVLKPLSHLVEAAQKIASGKYGTQIDIESDTEIGLLTESFNSMSLKVSEAKTALESKIKELEQVNRDLNETQAQLVHSAKMVSLGQLVAGVAHELNNPIGFIYSNMSHLKDYSDRLSKLVEVAETSPKDLAKSKKDLEFDYITQDMPRLIKSCEDGARRVRDIVLSLRNFSRLDESQVKEVDINEALENTLQLLSGELKNRIKVHKNFGKLPPVKCFASQINQVFMNIFTNAAQAIEGEGEIWVATAAAGGFVDIKIKDSGKGMPDKTIDKIFDPFFTTKPVGQGTGLGLSISYGIIQRHGGEIKVQSEVGKGTEFSVRIPINSTEEQNT